MGIPSPSGGAKQQSGGGPGGRPPERVIPFGKYQLLERVSVGGMAEVFKAKSFGIEGFEKILAIKRILPTMAEDGDFIEMFIDEAKIAGQLNHANICPIYELGKVGDSHYIAMEFVWGKDLLQLMNRFRKMRKHMPPAMVAWIGAKACEGLDYAHRKRDRNGNPMNIIHRDMSPQNVLVSYEGQVKVIDFGIAKAASRTTKTQAGVLKGKFGYMSPEQVRGLPVDARSDLFAIGTCMHEMSTGERLFLGESDFTTLDPHFIMSRLRTGEGYFNRQLTSWTDRYKLSGAERRMWAEMRMPPTDIMDIGAPTYTFLANGRGPTEGLT